MMMFVDVFDYDKPRRICGEEMERKPQSEKDETKL
jgi:hypothetical protein